MKKWFKTPTKEQIQSHKSLAFIKHYLDDPDLWHITKKSISRATLVGLFMTFMPMPFQMVAAVIICLIIRANIILSIVLCWISNPISMGPMMYACYRLGCYLLNYEPNGFPASLNDILSAIANIWQPLVLGCVVTGTFFGIMGYIFVILAWKWIGQHREHKDTEHDQPQ